MNPARDPKLALIGDVGGTNARLAIADLSGPVPVIGGLQVLPCAAFPDFADLLRVFLAGQPYAPPPAGAVVAVAATLRGGAGDFVNRNWYVSEAGLAAMGFARPRLINDFQALAMACPWLEPGDLRSVGAPQPGAAGANIAVIGAGTGFGAAALARDGVWAAALASEGGHIGFAPTDDLDAAILSDLSARFGRVSVERILSGPGLVNLYQALAAIHRSEPELTTPESILAAAADDRLAHITIDRFCRIFGAAAGDYALAYGAWGGVYLNGAIANSLYNVLNAGAFRDRFEAKGRMSVYLRETPVYVIARTDAALLGAARLAADMARN